MREDILRPTRISYPKPVRQLERIFEHPLRRYLIYTSSGWAGITISRPCDMEKNGGVTGRYPSNTFAKRRSRTITTSYHKRFMQCSMDYLRAPINLNTTTRCVEHPLISIFCHLLIIATQAIYRNSHENNVWIRCGIYRRSLCHQC